MNGELDISEIEISELFAYGRKNITVREHFVPRFYLKQFANNDGKIIHFDTHKNDFHQVYPKDILFENNLYETPWVNVDKEKTGEFVLRNDIESTFGKYKTEFAKLLSQIKKICITNQNPNALILKSEDVINLFSDVRQEFSLFDPAFLEEIGKMKEKNLAVELLKRLIAEQIHIYKRTNFVKSGKFSDIIHEIMNRCLNGMLTNEQVIEELLILAKQISRANEECEELGLSSEELAFYDALTKPQAIKDFYENEELIAITRKLAEAL